MSEDTSLTGRHALVTGATNGIGRATAEALVRRGATVTALCRNREKGEALQQALADAPGRIELLEADLSRLDSVRRAAETYRDSGQPLHWLINNAGIVNTRRRLSTDGYEEMFAVNHLAHFLLTLILLPRLRESRPARIVNVSSGAHGFARGGMGFDDLNAERRFRTFPVYGRSKLANLLFTRELARRLDGSGVTVNAVHPGAVRTGLGTQNHPRLARALGPLLAPFFRTPTQGAATSLYVALAPELADVSGQYFVNQKPRRPKPWAEDDDAAAELWRVSCQLTGYEDAPEAMPGA